MGNDLGAALWTFFMCGILLILAIWGIYELVDYYFIDTVIKVQKPLIPEIELVVKNNIVDTLYVYRIK